MTSRIVLALRHIGFEDLGSFEIPLRALGYEIKYIDVVEHNLTTLDPLSADLMVVLGGPIGVYDHIEYPFLSDEIELIKARLAADLPTLGICLGAQLIAAAFDAPVYPVAEKEIGWSQITLCDVAGENPLRALTGIPVLHWHGDTFDLPDGATLLASSEVCQNQAFSYGPNVLGVQFHPEVVGARFEHWLLGHANELAIAELSPVKLRSEAESHAGALQTAAVVFLKEWLKQLRI